LKFSIDGSQLSLSDPSYDPAFSLQRTINASETAAYKQITGEWLAQLASDSQTSQVLIADGSKLSICSGAIFNYQITAKYYIKLTLQNQGGCQDAQLISIIQKISFYRKFDGILELYDNNINLIINAKFKPSGRTVIPESLQPVAQGPVINTKPTTETGFTEAKYFLLLLLQRTAGRRPVQVTSFNITIELCSTIIFEYKILSATDIQITYKTTYDPFCQKVN
jgi:hypothetical protein